MPPMLEELTSDFLLTKAKIIISFINNAPVKLFCPHPPSRAALGSMEKMCVIRKGGALENQGIKEINEGGAR